MDTFRDVWEEQVRLLTEAVDDITTVDDFLIVSGKITVFIHQCFETALIQCSKSSLVRRNFCEICKINFFGCYNLELVFMLVIE